MSRPADPKRFPVRANGYSMTELQVCQSNAGFYIGRMGWDEEFGFEEPGSRESTYFRTREEAETKLQQGFEVRDCHENNSAYQSGRLPDIRKEL